MFPPHSHIGPDYSGMGHLWGQWLFFGRCRDGMGPTCANSSKKMFKSGFSPLIWCVLGGRSGRGHHFADIKLRVFAPKNDGVYYRRCRRPGSDFDETRSRRGYGPKTKCWTPVLTVRVSTGCLGGSKGADFDRSKKRVFGQIFFSSNRTERFAMAFS